MKVVLLSVIIYDSLSSQLPFARLVSLLYASEMLKQCVVGVHNVNRKYIFFIVV